MLRRRLSMHQGRDRAKAGIQAGTGTEAELGRKLNQKQIKGSDKDRGRGKISYIDRAKAEVHLKGVAAAVND